MPGLNALRMFAAVVEAGDIRQAAERLGRTPSAVSMALKQLEQELGGRLFEGDRKNKLTKLGAFTFKEGKEVLCHYERAVLSIGAYARNAIGRIDVACVPSVAIAIMPQVVARLRHVAPGMEIALRDADSGTVIREVEQSQAETGIASVQRPMPGLTTVTLFFDPIGLVCRADDPLTRLGTPVEWRHVEGREVFINGSFSLLKGEEWKAASRQAAVSVSNTTSALALVREGLGVTVLSHLSISRSSDEFAFLPIRNESAFRAIGLVTRHAESQSPATALFVSLLREIVDAQRDRLGIVPAGDKSKEGAQE